MLLLTRAHTALDPADRATLAAAGTAIGEHLPEWIFRPDPVPALERPGGCPVALWPLHSAGLAALVATAAQPPVLFNVHDDPADVAARLRRALIPDRSDEDASRWARLGRAAALTLTSPGAAVEETSSTQLTINLPVGPDGWIRLRLSGTGAEASGTFRFVPTAALASLGGKRP